MLPRQIVILFVISTVLFFVVNVFAGDQLAEPTATPVPKTGSVDFGQPPRADSPDIKGAIVPPPSKAEARKQCLVDNKGKHLTHAALDKCVAIKTGNIQK